MQSDYTSLVVDTLLNVPSGGAPGDLWRAVRVALTTWESVELAEAAALLGEAAALIHDPLIDGQPPSWQWNLRDDMEMLGRIAANERVTVTAVLHVLRVNLVAHRWHIDHRGVDRFVDIRWRFVDMLGRLLMDLEPADWERALMERPVGPATGATIGQLIRRRRLARELTQADLAGMLGVVRFSVGNWERDQARPTVANAVALAAALGGEPGDYLT